MKTTVNLAIWASGSGTNAENIFRYFEAHPSIRVALIVCNNPKAGVLDRANRLGLPVLQLDRTQLYDPTWLRPHLEKYAIDFHVLAGFLWLIPHWLIEHYPDKIINIHPALLPAYGGKGMYGMKVHQAVKDAGATSTGITIHYVDAAYDEGDVIFQAECPVLPEDTCEDIAARVHALEYQHYPAQIEKTVIREMHLAEGAA